MFFLGSFAQHNVTTFYDVNLEKKFVVNAYIRQMFMYIHKIAKSLAKCTLPDLIIRNLNDLNSLYNGITWPNRFINLGIIKLEVYAIITPMIAVK